ncbi:hypothetical protein [Protofrankia coriariae]|uniref:hypothetical protein n=1 Tax=Protofrankia coriariae TaxID=1562887 RepID=UPI000A54011C|nr:hypothetical protein [Protofrankia coriariae]
MRDYIARRGINDAWLCRCDNTPEHDGFLPVSGHREAESASPHWRGHYCCLR